MKNVVVFSIVASMLLLIITGCARTNNEIESNNYTVYNHVILGIDETNLHEVVGYVDYAFVGIVIEHLKLLPPRSLSTVHIE